MPVRNGYRCIHIASEITDLAARDRRPCELLRALKGEITFSGDQTVFSRIFEQLQAIDLKVANKFARNFFCMKGRTVTPLGLYGEAPEFLAKKLLFFANERDKNSPTWQHALEQYVRRIVANGTTDH